MKKIFLTIILASLFTITGYCAEVDTPSDEMLSYKIKSGDTLEISVYEEPDLNKTVKVSEEGKIIYPFIGEVKIGNLTVKEASREIENRLKEGFLVNPQVSIFVKEHSKFFVVGAVKIEGRYELKGNVTLLDAIALAGGTEENANLSEIKVIRKTENEDKEYVLDLYTQGKDFLLEPLDRVLIEEYGRISVLGTVNTPGSYYLKKNTNVVDALAFANGAKETADLSKIKITRQEGEEKRDYIVNLETDGQGFLLRNKDIVFIEAYDKISVFGQVNKPGSYDFKPGLTVVDAIAIAGGFTAVASQNGVTLVREKESKRKIFNVPVGSILKSGDKSRDILLEEGDIITVAESVF
jgi:polysaccharide export outer membrane protein